jgi:hypothetical protein
MIQTPLKSLQHGLLNGGSYTLCIMPRESHQNEVGRSHRSVAFYLRSSRNIALTKIHFKYFLGLYSLEKEHKIAKINLGLSHRPCFDDSFPGPERELCIMHSVYCILPSKLTHKNYSLFFTAPCATDFITPYHDSLLAETPEKHAVGVIHGV